MVDLGVYALRGVSSLGGGDKVDTYFVVVPVCR